MRHARRAGAVRSEHRLHVMAGARAHELPAMLGEDIGDRLGILLAQRLAGEYDHPRIDVVRVQLRPRIGVVNDAAQRRIVDPLLALVGREGHRGPIDPRKR